MPNSLEADLQRLLHLPWTILREETPEGDLLLRVKEIPSAVGCGRTEADLVADLWESLTESLRAYLHFGDAIPTPDGTSDSWRNLNPKPDLPNAPFIVSAVSATSGASAVSR